MAAQDEIYARLLADYNDKDIRQRLVDVDHLWYYFNLINQITGGGGGGSVPFIIYDDIIAFALSDPTQYTVGTIIEVTDASNPIVVNGDQTADAFYTTVILDASGTKIYSPVISILMNGGYYRGYILDALGGSVFTFENSIWSVEQLQSNVAVNNLDAFPISTPIKIISNVTVLPTPIDYILTEIAADSSGHKTINNQCTAYYNDGTTALGEYDLTTNTFRPLLTPITLTRTEALTATLVEGQSYKIVGDEAYNIDFSGDALPTGYSTGNPPTVYVQDGVLHIDGSDEGFDLTAISVFPTQSAGSYFIKLKNYTESVSLSEISFSFFNYLTSVGVTNIINGFASNSTTGSINGFTLVSPPNFSQITFTGIEISTLLASSLVSFTTNAIKDVNGNVVFSPVGIGEFADGSKHQVQYDLTNDIIAEAPFKVEDLQADVAGNLLDAFAIGTPIKIVSGSTSLPSSIDYILSQIIDSAGHKTVSSNCTAYVGTKEIPCFYDLSANIVSGELSATLLIGGSIDAPTVTVIENNLQNDLLNFTVSQSGVNEVQIDYGDDILGSYTMLIGGGYGLEVSLNFLSLSHQSVGNCNLQGFVFGTDSGVTGMTLQADPLFSFESGNKKVIIKIVQPL